jgi:hypothetical protein
MKPEVVLSPVKDEKMNSHIDKSKIWENAYHPEEVTSEIRKKYPIWYRYSIKFDGTKPIQMTKMEII